MKQLLFLEPLEKSFNKVFAAIKTDSSGFVQFLPSTRNEPPKILFAPFREEDKTEAESIFVVGSA